jgi:hypothetical protein
MQRTERRGMGTVPVGGVLKNETGEPPDLVASFFFTHISSVGGEPLNASHAELSSRIHHAHTFTSGGQFLCDKPKLLLQPSHIHNDRVCPYVTCAKDGVDHPPMAMVSVSCSTSWTWTPLCCPCHCFQSHRWWCSRYQHPPAWILRPC